MHLLKQGHTSVLSTGGTWNTGRVKAKKPKLKTHLVQPLEVQFFLLIGLGLNYVELLGLETSIHNVSS